MSIAKSTCNSTAVNIPSKHPAIARDTVQSLTRSAKSNSMHGIRMPLQRAYRLTTVGVPQHHIAVIAASGDQFTVWRHGYPVHTLAMGPLAVRTIPVDTP